MDINKWFKKVFSSFDSLNKEFSLEFCFISVNQKDTEALVAQ